ncbi:hypothetical protein ACE2AJ_16445 [Aquihabitans daechungensis]|uniref:hypothetical protein n=1 Tax=Aquihabitans daechungensis TaxID=1052257 RepID=UPI003BA37675
MTITELAVGAAAGYFFVFGTGFVFRPGLVDRFALRWTDPAGKTEVRCYYGAVSWALAGFLAYLLTEDLAVQALTGVLFLATSVLVVRIAGTLVDGGRDHPYTRMAIPVETAFVVAVAAVRFLA